MAAFVASAVVVGFATLAAPAAGALDCSKPLVVGVHGNGEDAGFGPTVGEAVRGFRSQYFGDDATPADEIAIRTTTATTASLLFLLSVTPQTLAPFLSGVQTGLDEVEWVLAVRANQCPAQRIVLFGYSQGAMVLTRVLTEYLPDRPDIAARIDAVGLIADPLRRGGLAYDSGTASSRTNGIVVAATHDRRVLPPALAVRTESYCRSGDAVCGFSLRDLTRLHLHSSYSLGAAYGVGQRAAARLAPNVAGLDVHWLSAPSMTFLLGSSCAQYVVRACWVAESDVEITSSFPQSTAQIVDPYVLIHASSATNGGFAIFLGYTGGTGSPYDRTYAYRAESAGGTQYTSGVYSIDRVCLVSDAGTHMACRPPRPAEMKSFTVSSPFG